MRESLQQTISRPKSGLETPLSGRFIGEDKYLVFAPPKWYEMLVAGCLIFGPIQTLLAWQGLWVIGFLAQPWVGMAVFLAGVWALLSAERLVCVPREGTYVRQEGGLMKLRISRGKLSELDAIVLVAENKSLNPVAVSAAFRLVIHWKDGRHPPLVVERFDANVPSIALLGQAASPLLSKAVIYGKALGIPVYNNSQSFSGAPLKPF